MGRCCSDMPALALVHLDECSEHIQFIVFGSVITKLHKSFYLTQSIDVIFVGADWSDFHICLHFKTRIR